MKKTLLTVLFGALFLTANMTHAQKANIGLNAAGAFPLGDFGNNNPLGFGGDVSFDYYFNDLFDIGIEAGYKHFSYDVSSIPEGEGVRIIPIQLTAGIHGDINDWIDIYGELGGGLFLSSDSYFDRSTSYGGISPRVGAAFELNSVWFLDVNVNYTHVFSEETIEVNEAVYGLPTMNWIGVNIGVLYTIQEW